LHAKRRLAVSQLDHRLVEVDDLTEDFLWCLLRQFHLENQNHVFELDEVIHLAIVDPRRVDVLEPLAVNSVRVEG